MNKRTVEIYALLIPATILLASIVVAHTFFVAHKFNIEFIEKFLLYPSIADESFHLILYPTLTILILKLTSHFRNQKQKEIGATPLFNFRNFLKSTAAIILTIYVSLLATGFASYLLFLNVSPTRTYDTTVATMRAEYAVFGTLPSLSIQKSTPAVIEKIIVHSYNAIFIVAAITLIATMLFSTLHFRGVILAFFYTIIFGLLMWYIIPVLCPGYMFFMYDVLGLHIPQFAANYYDSFTASEYLKHYVLNPRNYWIFPNNTFLPISTFPSAHSAWGVIFTFYAYRLYKPLILIYGPWLIFNLIGTFYVLQHYVLDTLSGIALGIFAISITQIILSRYRHDPSKIFYALDVIQNDLKHWNKKLFPQNTEKKNTTTS